MGNGFWSDIRFSIARSICLETLGFTVVQVLFGAIAYTLAVATDSLPTTDFRGLTPEEAKPVFFRFLSIVGGLTLLVLPAYVFLISSLNGRVFGQPVPVGPVWGALRLIKAYILFVLAIALVIAAPLGFFAAILSKLLPEDHTPVVILFVVVGLWGFWFVTAHAFYGLGILYHGRFGFGEARALSRGRRWALLGGMLVLGLASAIASLLIGIAALLLPQSPARDLLLGSVQFATQVPILIFLCGHFFHASAASARLTPTGAGLFFDTPPPSRGL